MFSINYRNQIVILVLWIIAVMALFKFIPDKQVASVVAGMGFVLFPILFLVSELKGSKQVTHILVLSVFLVFSALPIFFLRIFNWGSDFGSLEILGVSGNSLHKASSYLYMVMLLSSIYHFVKLKKKSTN
jgi:hypothetical protein